MISFKALLILVALVTGFFCGMFLTLVFVHEKSPNLYCSWLPGHSGFYANAPVPFNLANDESRKYLFAENVQRRVPVPLEHPAHLRQEYNLRKPLFVGVLSSQEFLPTRARAVYDTWAGEVSNLVFFVGEDCNISAQLSSLPVIKLKGVPDKVYPPFLKAFAMMQYMHDHFLSDYNWFIRADDDVYVRGHKLIELLHSFDESEVISLGRAGEGRANELTRLQLLRHERYCMGGPGMIFSRAALKALGPYLQLCRDAVLYHDQHSPSKWQDDDVEIGRCISRELGVQCSTSHEGRKYFYQDFVGESLNPEIFWTRPEYREMITIHPVKNPDNIRSLHLFYKSVDYEDIYCQKKKTEGSLVRLCNSLPTNLVPPSFKKSSCKIEFFSSHYYDEDKLPQPPQLHHHHKSV